MVLVVLSGLLLNFNRRVTSIARRLESAKYGGRTYPFYSTCNVIDVLHFRLSTRGGKRTLSCNMYVLTLKCEHTSKYHLRKQYVETRALGYH